MDRTTDLNIIQQHRELFTWGGVIAFHDVGPYTIVEYYPWVVEGVAVRTGTPDYDRRSYHGYICGKSTSRSWPTLDAALAGLVAYRQEGPNSRAATYFIRMLSDH